MSGFLQREPSWEACVNKTAGYSLGGELGENSIFERKTAADVAAVFYVRLKVVPIRKSVFCHIFAKFRTKIGNIAGAKS